MGVNIRANNAVFTKSLGLLLPFKNNLVGYWNFSKGLEEGRKNQVTGNKATLAGSPTVVDGSLRTDRSNGLLTDITLSGPKTYVAISASADASPNGIIVGSMVYETTSSGSQDGLVFLSGTVLTQVDRGGTGARLMVGVVSPITPYLVAGTIGVGTSGAYLRNANTSQSAELAITGDPFDNKPVQIGGWSPSKATLDGSIKVYSVLLYNRVLSSAEIDELYQYLATQISELT